MAINLDRGQSVHSNRTQFIKRIVQFAKVSGLHIHLIYYPPYHSKYNPIERCWAALEIIGMTLYLIRLKQPYRALLLIV